MRAAFLGAWLLANLFGCSPTAPPPTPTAPSQEIVDVSCESIADAVNLTCLDVPPESLLLQTHTQITLRTLSFTVTFDSTILLTNSEDEWRIAPLDGLGVVSAGDTTRIVHPGSFVSTRENAPITFAEPYYPDPSLEDWLSQLDRPVSLPEAAIAPTEPTAKSTNSPTGCLRPPDWSQPYTVQRGDTLSGIASIYGVSVDELREYNCLLNPNQLSPGDILHVPMAFTDGTATPFVVIFEADSNSLASGDCTTIRWDAAAATVVYFQGEATARVDSRSVCPELTSTYTLLVVDANGAQMGYTLTITVE